MPIKLAAFKKKEKQQSALHQYRSTTSSSASPESCTTSKYFTKVTCHFRVTVAIRPQHVFVQIRPQLKKKHSADIPKSAAVIWMQDGRGGMRRDK